MLTGARSKAHVRDGLHVLDVLDVEELFGDFPVALLGSGASLVGG